MTLDCLEENASLHVTHSPSHSRPFLFSLYHASIIKSTHVLSQRIPHSTQTSLPSLSAYHSWPPTTMTHFFSFHLTFTLTHKSSKKSLVSLSANQKREGERHNLILSLHRRFTIPPSQSSSNPQPTNDNPLHLRKPLLFISNTTTPPLLPSPSIASTIVHHDQTLQNLRPQPNLPSSSAARR